MKNTKKNFVVGNSLIEIITAIGISRTNTFKMRPHPGATIVDICNYIKPELRHKPDVIIIHCGTNDMENVVNKVKTIKKLVKELDKYDQQNPPKVDISSLIKRCDQDFNDHIVNINEKVQRLCNDKGLAFLANNKIGRSCLVKAKLHLNRRGSSYEVLCENLTF